VAITRIQAVAGAPVHLLSAVSATLPGAPTVGNTIIGFLYNNDNSSPPGCGSVVGSAWTVAHDVGNTSSVVTDIIVVYRVVKAGDTATYTVTVSGTITDGSLLLVEYAGLGSAPAIDVKDGGSRTAASSSAIIPTITPAGGAERLILAHVALSPNYGPGVPGTWTQVLTDGGAGNRQTMQWLETIVASTSGSYGGDTLTPAGPETDWWIPITAFMTGVAGSPILAGQPGGGFL
jgi:hypothetical protein